MKYLYGVLVAAILLGCGPNGLDPTNGQDKQEPGSDGGSTGEQDKLQQGAEQYTFLDGTWSSPWGEEWSFDISSGDVEQHRKSTTEETIVRSKIQELTENRLQLYTTLVQIKPFGYPEQEPLTQDAPNPGSYYFVVNDDEALVHLDIARYIVDADTSKDITKFSEYIIRDKDYFPKFYSDIPETGELNQNLEQFVRTNASKKNTDIANVDGTTYVKSIYEKESKEYREVDNHTVVYSFAIYDKYGNYRWKLGDNTFEEQESDVTSEVQALINDGWEVRKPTSDKYRPTTYTMQYSESTETLTLTNTEDNTVTELTRKED